LGQAGFQAGLAVLSEIRYGIIAALVAGFGRVIAEIF
jgi:ABC-type tungstate transport system substrate-binding protein